MKQSPFNTKLSGTRIYQPLNVVGYPTRVRLNTDRFSYSYSQTKNQFLDEQKLFTTNHIACKQLLMQSLAVGPRVPITVLTGEISVLTPIWYS